MISDYSAENLLKSTEVQPPKDGLKGRLRKCRRKKTPKIRGFNKN